jgi:hypothetical protein
MEEIIDTTMLEEEEDDDLMVYCICEGAKDIFIKRKDAYYSSLIGKYLIDSEMNFREFFRISRDIF